MFTELSVEQSPYAGAPVIGKCLVACPVSLINVSTSIGNEFYHHLLTNLELEK